jgi:hypothetical protein
MDITKRPLSGMEMMALNPDAKLYRYTDLYNYDNVEDLFGDSDKIIILYLLQSASSGHWVALFKNKDGLNYFDSYGVPEDYQFELLPFKQRQKLHEEQNYLKKMLFHKKVCFNNITYQGKGTATCGCFVSHRLHNYRLNDLQYFNIFARQKLTPDEYVSKWCFSKLKNLM